MIRMFRWRHARACSRRRCLRGRSTIRPCSSDFGYAWTGRELSDGSTRGPDPRGNIAKMSHAGVSTHLQLHYRTQRSHLPWISCECTRRLPSPSQGQAFAALAMTARATLKMLEDRGELVVGLGDAAAKRRVVADTGCAAIVARHRPHRQKRDVAVALGEANEDPARRPARRFPSLRRSRRSTVSRPLSSGEPDELDLVHRVERRTDRVRLCRICRSTSRPSASSTTTATPPSASRTSTSCTCSRTEYLLYYVLGDVLALVMGVKAASVAMICLYLGGMPLAMRELLRALGRDERLALFVVPLSVNVMFCFGLLPFVFGFPLMLLALAAAARHFERPTLRSGLVARRARDRDVLRARAAVRPLRDRVHRALPLDASEPVGASGGAPCRGPRPRRLVGARLEGGRRAPSSP